MGFQFECIGCGNWEDCDPASPDFDVSDYHKNCDYCGTDGCGACLRRTMFEDYICDGCADEQTDEEFRDPFDEEETERNDEGD